MADAADGLRPFLPTADEIGPGFTVGDEPKPDSSTPVICGGPGTASTARPRSSSSRRP
jgi:hypothetical protein